MIVNLEPLCASCGKAILEANSGGKMKVEDKENTINKALGVLAENGLYAMAVYLLSCNKKEYGLAVLSVLADFYSRREIDLLERAPADAGNVKENLLNAVRGLTESLPKLLLARKLTEQALIFARYHAKAKTFMGQGDQS